jgi:hypothetical protein
MRVTAMVVEDVLIVILNSLGEQGMGVSEGGCLFDPE